MRDKDLAELRRTLWDMRSLLEAALAIVEPDEVWYQTLSGAMSTFGGPGDDGVSPDEGLALIEPSEVDEFDEDLFLDEQPAGTTGLARRLNPDYVPGYIACRWDYDVTSREWLQTHTVSVKNPLTGKTIFNVQPVDWGPHEDTGRICDLSPGLAARLELETDDLCEVHVPIPAPALA
jgi:hypothetical protein